MFDTEKQLEKIYEINDFLPKLSVLVDFEQFRPLIDQARPVKPQPKGGKKTYDNVLVCKVLVLKYLPFRRTNRIANSRLFLKKNNIFPITIKPSIKTELIRTALKKIFKIIPTLSQILLEIDNPAKYPSSDQDGQGL
jgi:hypothetical protein